MSLKKIDFHNGLPYQTDEGLFYYAADVDAILNSVQQLKVKISIEVERIDDAFRYNKEIPWSVIVENLRKITAA